MTVTRTPLCTTKYCPAPNDPDWHHCLVTGSNVIEHHHVEGRGKVRTMDKKKVVPLAPPIHKKISLNEYGDAILDLDGSKVYRIFDLHNETIHEGVHWWMQDGRRLSDGAEGEQVSKEAVIGPSAPSLSKEESDEEHGEHGEHGEHQIHHMGNEHPDTMVAAENSRVLTAITANDSHNRQEHHREYQGEGLTHEQRVVIAQEIKDAEWNRQWIAGDTGNAWIAELGEEAEQYLSDFGYVHESLANILRVCAAIKPPYRNGSLRFSHHVVVADLNREDMEMWLDKCEEEQWSVAEFRRQVKGTKLKTKRWALSELLEGVEEWPHPTDRPRPKGAVRAYLAWLGER